MSIVVDEHPPFEAEPLVVPQFVPASQIVRDHPTQDEPIIDGLIRRGETANIISAAKVGKSWLSLGMALSVASGRDWLGRPTREGQVAIVDNELRPSNLAFRLQTVCHAMAIPEGVLDRVKVLSLRGQLRSIYELWDSLESIQGEDYSLLVLDAMYRAIPEGVSENDNAQMAGVFNIIDSYAMNLDLAITMIHHSSKGDQSGKSVTDVGSGAGSISRAADTHLILRPHEQDDCAVMEGACRSFPPIKPMTVGWCFPCWEAKHIEPVVKVPKGRSARKQENNDAQADEDVLDVMASEAAPDGEWLSTTAIRKRVDFGQQRVERAIVRLLKAEKIATKKVKNPGNKKQKIDVYHIA